MKLQPSIEANWLNYFNHTLRKAGVEPLSPMYRVCRTVFYSGYACAQSEHMQSAELSITEGVAFIDKRMREMDEFTAKLGTFK
jgi:hypothetical protein